jgi:hypothetical protein
VQGALYGGSYSSISEFDFRPGAASRSHQNFVSDPTVTAGTTARFSFTHFADTWIMGGEYVTIMSIDWNKNGLYESTEFSPAPGAGIINENGFVDVTVPSDADGVYSLMVYAITDNGFDMESFKSGNQFCSVSCSEMMGCGK